MRSAPAWLVVTLFLMLTLASCGGDGAATTTQSSVTIKLDGTAQDKTLPNGSLAVNWTKVSGPGPVIIADASSPDTTATFFKAGLYVLRLTASDAEFTVSDDVVITIEPLD